MITTTIIRWVEHPHEVRRFTTPPITDKNARAFYDNQMHYFLPYDWGWRWSEV